MYRRGLLTGVALLAMTQAAWADLWSCGSGNNLLGLTRCPPATTTPVTRTQNIASYLRTPGWTLGACTANGNTQTQAYMPCWNDSGATATNIQLVFSNWWLQINGLVGEWANGNALTITAGIEASYGGAVTQVLFSGVAAGTVAGGVNLVSDAVAISIPAGQKFGIRVLAVATGSPVSATTTAAGANTTTLKVPTAGLSVGMGVSGGGIAATTVFYIQSIGDAATCILNAPISAAQAPITTALTFSPVVPICWGANTGGTGSLSEAGTALTDKTLSGTVVGTVAGFGPSAVLGSVTSPRNACVAVLGDSISVGASDGNFAAHGGTGIYGRSCDNLVPCMGMGVTGSSATNQQGHTAMRTDLMAKAGVTHAIVEYGTNDLTSATVANITTWLNIIHAAIKTAIPTAKVYQTTIIPRTTSTDGWTTTGNQTPVTGFTGGAGSNRATLNAAIRSLTGFASLTGFLEMADALESTRNSGLFVAGASHTDVQSTGSHTSQNVLTGAFTGTPTTTQMQLAQTTMTLNQYQFGKMLITSGAAASATVRSVSSNTVGGLVTIPALGVAPAAGDSYVIWAITDVNTGDGVHPSVTGTNSPFFGGVYYGVDALRPVITSWM